MKTYRPTHIFTGPPKIQFLPTTPLHWTSWITWVSKLSAKALLKVN